MTSDDLIPLNYYVATAQGKRDYMEDTYCIAELPNKRTVFAVFDGHGGLCAAKHCATNFPSHVMDMSDFKQSSIKTLFNDIDIKVCDECPTNCGTTALAMFVDQHHLHFANCGDSLAILCDTDDNIHMMSMEHKVEHEQDRIRDAGGVVTYTYGMARIFYMLNLSRSIGDAFLKEYVISEPHVSTHSIEKTKWILMATDGLWDVFSANDVAKEISMYEALNGSTEDARKGLPAWLIKRAINNFRSTDNITVMYITVR